VDRVRYVAEAVTESVTCDET
jgi:hypothetical protein